MKDSRGHRQPRTGGRPALEEFLLSNMRRGTTRLHMPGHKGPEIFVKTGHGRLLDHLAEIDITEIPGADDLFNPDPEGPIGAMQAWYAALYQVKKSYLMVNGASGGILAAVLAVCGRGDALIVARNCHKAVTNAMALGQIRPVYVYPDIIEEYGICGPVRAEQIEEAIRENSDARAVLVTSPNYYGVLSDIRAIAEVCRRHNKVLIVDQAHGAHLAFFDEVDGTCLSAERGGADLIINSIHKTLAGFGQTAVLNVQGKTAHGPCEGGVDLLALEDRLQQVQTSSPSYILLASLDANGEILENNRGELIYEWGKDVRRFYEEAAQLRGVRCIPPAPWMDPTKINLGVTEPPLSGEELARRLREDYGIQVELHTHRMVMCLTGLGTRWADLSKLLQALRRITESHTEEQELQRPYGRRNTQEMDGSTPVNGTGAAVFLRKAACRESAKAAAAEADEEAWIRPHSVQPVPDEKEWIPLQDAAGRTAAAAVTPYPPGVPVVCPGEVYTAEDIGHIEGLLEEGGIVMGISDSGKVQVGKNSAK
ncbi:MAG: aminotransferase class I/II-fold pyridoxal phosphate-dependent enzyme [Clostridiales bacterium]|nr:aminotransferase class I/II-fold pyridoxal phosphate-dependent enzyme [Clostridiales bacterium]